MAEWSKVKISQLIVAAGLAAASLVGYGGTVVAAPAAPAAAVSCVDGVLAMVTDDSGVQRQACVASAAADPVAPTPASAKSALISEPVPTTGPAQLPRTGAGTGGLVIAALLVGCGSIASLLSRRKADRR